MTYKYDTHLGMGFHSSSPIDKVVTDITIQAQTEKMPSCLWLTVHESQSKGRMKIDRSPHIYSGVSAKVYSSGLVC